MNNGRVGADELDVDLRDYLDVLRRRWRLVLVPLIVALVAGALFSLLPTAQYEATGYLLITKPPLQPQFDPRLASQEILPSGKVYSILAKSPDVLQRVVEKLGAPINGYQVPASVRSTGAIESMVSISNREDPALVAIVAHDPDPKIAMTVANAYLDAASEVIGEAYSPAARTEKFIAEQLKSAQAGLDAADQALIEFERTSPITSLQAQVNAAQYRQQQLYFGQDAIDLSLRDAGRVRQQLVASNGSSTAAAANEVLLQTLLLRYLDVRGQLPPANPIETQPSGPNGRPVAQSPAPVSAAPVQLQLALDQALATNTPLDERLKNLDSFVTLLKAERDELGRSAQRDEASLQDLKRQLTEQAAKEDRLKLDRDTARSTLTTLRNKADEARLTAQSTVTAARVASYATLPDAPMSRRLPLNVGVAAAIGLAIGVLLAFAVEYLSRPPLATVPVDVTPPGARREPEALRG